MWVGIRWVELGWFGMGWAGEKGAERMERARVLWVGRIGRVGVGRGS